MELIKYIIECDVPLLINKEYVADSFPLCFEWFKGHDLILEPRYDTYTADNITRADFQKIKIMDNVYIFRKGISKKGKTKIVPFLFLESVRRGDYERARKVLNFHINDQKLKEYFGDFEILVNNYLGHENVFSILPKDSDIAKNFVFEIVDAKIANITNV